jgi:hypothetical protein
MGSTTPRLDRTAPTDGLAELVDRPGPFLTVVVDTDPAVDNASHRSVLRWRAQREEAAARGAAPAALATVDALVPDAHLDGPALFAVVDGTSGELVLAEPLAALPATGPLCDVAPLPRLVPLVADRQARLPHVVVRCDREGADVLAVDGDGRTDASHVRDDGRPYRHARSVGWRELRGWHRAERHLQTTAEEVARVTADAAGRVGAGLVVVAGDDRTVQQVVERLGASGLDARPVPGGRGHDGSTEQVDAEAATVVRTAVAEDIRSVLRRFREQRAHGLAVAGGDETKRALAAGQVDVLLVHDELDDPDTDDALRRALGTGASVVVVPRHAGPQDGVGALLRWR